MDKEGHLTAALTEPSPFLLPSRLEADTGLAVEAEARLGPQVMERHYGVFREIRAMPRVVASLDVVWALKHIVPWQS